MESVGIQKKIDRKMYMSFRKKLIKQLTSAKQGNMLINILLVPCRSSYTLIRVWLALQSLRPSTTAVSKKEEV